MELIDITSWAMLLVALSPLLIAALRTDSMSENKVALLTVGCVALLFFVGKALDADLTWPLGQRIAGELAQALIAQQVIYLIVKKTSPIKALEQSGNAPAPAPGQDL